MEVFSLTGALAFKNVERRKQVIVVEVGKVIENPYRGRRSETALLQCPETRVLRKILGHSFHTIDLSRTGSQVFL